MPKLMCILFGFLVLNIWLVLAIQFSGSLKQLDQCNDMKQKQNTACKNGACCDGQHHKIEGVPEIWQHFRFNTK